MDHDAKTVTEPKTQTSKPEASLEVPSASGTATAGPARRGLFGWLKKNKPVEVAVRPPEETQREASLLQIKQGYSQVVDTMSAMRKHMEEQAERGDRMLTMMEQLPEALKSIPETTQRQTQVLQAIHENILNQNETSTRLSVALDNLAGAANQQDETLGKMNTQIQEAREQQAGMLDHLSGTLGQVSASSRSNAEAVEAIAEQAEAHELQTREMFARSQRLGMAMMAVSLMVLVVALIVGVVLVTQLREMSTAGAETPAAPIVEAAAGDTNAPDSASASLVPTLPDAADPVLNPAPESEPAPEQAPTQAESVPETPPAANDASQTPEELALPEDVADSSDKFEPWKLLPFMGAD